jgi:hypothetical protein
MVSLSHLNMPSLMRWLSHWLLPVVLAAIMGGVIGGMSIISPILALGAVVGLSFCLIAMSRQIVLCFVLIAATTLASGIVRGKIIPVLRPNEAVLVLAIGIMALVVLAHRRRILDMERYGAIVQGFAMLIAGTVFIPVITYTIRGYTIGMSEAMSMIAPIQFFLVFWIFATLVRSDAARRMIILWMMICTAIVAVVGLLQAAGVSFVRNVLTVWYASGHTDAVSSGTIARITSLMGAWNVLGMLLMTTLLIGWSTLPAFSQPLPRAIMLASMVLSTLCLLASGSFAGILGLMMGIGIIEMLNGRGLKNVPLLLIVISVTGLLLLPFYPIIWPLIEHRLSFQFDPRGNLIPHTLEYRFWVWRDIFWPHIVANPIWGSYLSVPHFFAWGYEESQYIMLLFRYGAIGLFVHFFWIFASLIWIGRRMYSSNQLQRAIAIAGFTIIAVLSVASLTNVVFSYSGTAEYLWILFALTAADTVEESV